MSEDLRDQIKHGLVCERHGNAHGAVEHALCIATHPGNMFLKPFYAHFERRYRGKYRYPDALFLLDLFLVGLIFGLALTAFVFFLYRPANIADKIFLEAEVAPSEIVSGAPSTLVIRYTNGTGEELHDVRATLGFPAHFLLQEGEQTVSLGTLSPGATGTVKVRGVMFGDVGGKQVFRTILTFTYGEKNRTEQKIAFHTFSPSRSTLALALRVPDRVVAYQPMSGTIIYKNTGQIDFPSIAIEPVWPEAFSFGSSSVPLQNDVWNLPAIQAGQEGEVTFTGTVTQETETVPFVFQPSFAFGDARYSQEKLAENVPVIIPQVRVSQGVEPSPARPGGTMEVTVHYENTGNTPVYHLRLTLETASPFATNQPSLMVGTVESKTGGDAVLSLPLRSSIKQSETAIYENLQINTRARATYDLEDTAETQTVTSYSSSLSTPLTTPVVLRSFGRYSSEQGDQLGRGPLPPAVGEKTTYWIFWNVNGTTNALTNVVLTGHLANGTEFTGRQTVSQGEAVAYDPKTNTVTWTAAHLNPTFPPGSKIIGIAFEVGMTPTEDQIGTTPLLLTDVRLTATDAYTGAVVATSGSSVTTNLPYDAMAAGFGTVVAF